MASFIYHREHKSRIVSLEEYDSMIGKDGWCSSPALAEKIGEDNERLPNRDEPKIEEERLCEGWRIGSELRGECDESGRGTPNERRGQVCDLQHESHEDGDSKPERGQLITEEPSSKKRGRPSKKGLKN